MEQPAAPVAHLWTVTDGHAGNVRQAEALAAALDVGPNQTCTLNARAPWSWVAPRRAPGSSHAFGRNFLTAAPPALAIGCGRQAALATRLLRERDSKVVQILDPRIDPHHWDLVIVPEHDRLRGANVIPMQGSLNPVDDTWLTQARLRFPHLGILPGPRTALLLGGDSAHWRFDVRGFEQLAAQLQAVVSREGGSILATTSRRTAPAVVSAARQHLQSLPGQLWCGEADDLNPYAGLLAWADRIVCTPDSVNMISEACATPAPVYVFAPEAIQGRPRHFLDNLLASGRIRALDATLSHFEVEPLRETQRIASLIQERLNLASPDTR